MARIEELAAARTRVLLGITGSPGAGKSTIAGDLVEALRTRGMPVVWVPMDGFHLADVELDRLGRRERKGAIDTFDGYGFVALLQRLKAASNEHIWAPRFDRALEDSIAASIGVAPEVSLVVTEGNYLLLDELPWTTVRTVLDQCWYVEVPERLRHQRLEARHMQFGRSREEAHERTFGSDERNAQLIAATAASADAIVELS